jgi:tRNA nucleotidyltransferase (CCA-adding enzyme)
VISAATEVPTTVLEIMERLEQAGFRAYLIGGSVRDMLLGRCPKDYDIATDAVPAQVKALFERAIPTGERFGTVTVRGEMDVEVTTFRKDGTYLDGRRPESVQFSKSLFDDVVRRDFTINALARTRAGEVIDHVGGLQDLGRRVIRTVGDPDERFGEDALRMMRALRFSAQLGDGFSIETATLEAISRNAHLILNVSWERIRDELAGILLSDRPGVVRDLHHTGLLAHILPELDACYGFDQASEHHDKDVFEHIVVALENTPPRLNVRLAALLHDVGKPATFSLDEEREGHFYGHHEESEEMARAALSRLRFDSRTVSTVSMLVREHMSRYGILRPKNIKRFIAKVGIENLQDLFDLQTADALASAAPHDLSKVLSLKREVKQVLDRGDPLTVKDLAITGRDLIKWGLKEGKDVGAMLDIMLDKVLDDPALNTPERLRNIFDRVRRQNQPD